MESRYANDTICFWLLFLCLFIGNYRPPYAWRLIISLPFDLILFFLILPLNLQYCLKLLTPLLRLFHVNTLPLSLGNAVAGCIFATVKLQSGRKVAAVELTSVKPWKLKCHSRVLKSFQSKVLLVTSIFTVDLGGKNCLMLISHINCSLWLLSWKTLRGSLRNFLNILLGAKDVGRHDSVLIW